MEFQRSSTQIPYFDWRSLSYLSDPLTHMREVASECPVARTETGYAVFRREHARLILEQDFPLSAYHLPADSSRYLQQRTAGSLSRRHGPLHQQLRRIVTATLRDLGREWLQSNIRFAFIESLERVFPCDELDLATDVFDDFPVRALARILGIPEEDRQQLAIWAASASKWTNVLVSPAALTEIEVAWKNMDRYLRRLLAKVREEGHRGLLGDLLRAMEGWGEDEVVNVAGGLLRAGIDTTRRQLACTALAFLRHPLQWQYLRTHPTKLDNAVEEGMRFAPMIHILSRQATHDFDFHGLLLHPGEVVSVMVFAVNRDPEFYRNPDDFDIDRRRIVHYTFGGGRHSCLGAPLARLMMREAFDVLTKRITHWDFVGKPELGGVAEGQVPRRLPVAIRMAQ